MALPVGLSLNPSTGAIVGQPVAAAAVDGEPTDYEFTVQAIDANGLVARQQYTITVYPAPTFTLTLPDGVVGVAYVGSAVTLEGSAPVVYSKVAGPAWMSVAGGGAITGVPDATGTNITVTIRATGDLGGVTNTTETINVV